MKEDVIEKLTSAYNYWKDNVEAQIRLHVIYDVFLTDMGYDKSKCTFDEHCIKGFVDVKVPVNEKEFLSMEIKRAQHSLDNQDFAQLNKYLNGKGQRYALLTNGREYVLMDFKIKCEPIDGKDVFSSYIVFWFDILNVRKERTNLNYFSYLSKTNMYETRTTQFYSDIAQYKAKKMETDTLGPDSWKAYASTLYNYYDFISSKYGKYQGVYGRMAIEDFQAYIRERKRKGDNTSIRTIQNCHTHIYNMLSVLKDMGCIRHINFDKSRNRSLEWFKETDYLKKPELLCREDVLNALQTYKSDKKATRNIVIYLLCVTIGLERSQILELKWNDFDKEFNYLNVDGRKIPLYNMIKRYLFQMRNEQGKKSEYVFVTKRDGKLCRVQPSTISDAFQCLKRSDKEIYSPKYMKRCLVLSMFYEGYSIDDIIFVSGIKLSNVEKYITTDMIIERHNEKINWRKMYDGILCDNL